MPPRRLVRVQNFKVASDDDARAAQFAQDVGHQLVIADQLVVQPDVAEREADLFEQVENQFQFHVHQRLAGHAAVKDRDPDDGIAAVDRHGDLRAKQFKFFLHLAVIEGFRAVAAEDAAQPVDLRADAGVQREFKMFEQAGGNSDGRSRAQPPRIFRRHGFRERRAGTVQKNRRAVDAQNFPEELQKLPEHRLGIERVREDRRKIAQHIERLRVAQKLSGGVGVSRRARKNGGVAGRDHRRRTRRRRVPKPIQHGVEQSLADRLGQNERDAAQKSFFFPLGLNLFGVGDDGRLGVAPADALDDPDAFDAHEVGVEDAGGGQTVNQQRFALVGTVAVNHAVLFRIQTRADGGGKIRMGRQNQNGLHGLFEPKWVCLTAVIRKSFSTDKARRSMWKLGKLLQIGCSANCTDEFLSFAGEVQSVTGGAAGLQP